MTDQAERVLLTGISGFIAKHCARELLENGYCVRGTVRNKARAEALRQLLAPIAGDDKLEIVEADLTSDANWDAAMEGVDHVMHTASPFPIGQPKDEQELIRPAVDGTMRVLRAAAVTPGIKTFTQTSSVVAVTMGHPQRDAPFTATDWSDLDSPHASAYGKSKTLAERAAREFIASEKPGFRFSTVNPGFVLGPLMDATFGTSGEVIKMFMNGKYPATPRVQFVVVDVRDVATLHRLALEKGQDGGRYLATERSMWMLEISMALRNHLGEAARKAPKRNLPNFMVRLLGLFDPAARSIIPDLDRISSVDNSATIEALGHTFRSGELAAAAMGQSLIEHKLL